MSPPILQTAHHHYPHLPSQPTTPHRSSQSLASSTQTPPNTEPSTSISPAEAALLPSMRRTKQLRPPRCTNYVPAVLRRTEWPSSGTATAAPSTGTAILASNLLTPPDSASVSLSGSLDDPKMLRTAKRHQSDVTPTKPDLLDEQRIFEEEWLNAEDEKGRPVVNEPTRLHWRVSFCPPLSFVPKIFRYSRFHEAGIPSHPQTPLLSPPRSKPFLSSGNSSELKTAHTSNYCVSHPLPIPSNP